MADIVFEDRKAAKPNRYLVTPENGEAAYYVTLKRADEPIVNGTVLSADILNTLYGEGHKPTPAEIGAAPAGYGLGATVKDINADALNTTTNNGWYRIANQSLTVGGYTYSDWYIHVTKYNTKNLVQELYTLNGYKAVRLCRNGTWYEEWDNPPMTTGVEYRTTDRIHAKAVYKKADANGSISYRLDGETAWYPEGTGIVKLWANANPTSTFDAHKVSVDLSQYQMVAIEYRFNTTDDYRKMCYGNVGSAMALDVVSTSGYLGWRSATVSTTGISFSTATYNGKSDIVGYIIPVAIYGVKGVTA